MAAGDEEDRVLAERARQISPSKRRFIKPDHDQADPAANPLDDGVCRQCGRQRDKADIADIAVKRVKHPVNGPADADRQIFARGQRFAGANDGTCRGVKKRGIGEGAAGIKADYQCHGLVPDPAGRALPVLQRAGITGRSRRQAAAAREAACWVKKLTIQLAMVTPSWPVSRVCVAAATLSVPIVSVRAAISAAV